MRTKDVTGTADQRISSKPGRADLGAKGQAGFEMANLRLERAGLPFVVFISQKGGARHDVTRQECVARRRSLSFSTLQSVVKGRLDLCYLDLLRHWLEINE
jgi:hypothetical protein